MTMSDTQTAPTKGMMTLREAVDEFQGQLVARAQEFAPSLPSHISAEKFQRTAVTAVNLNPDLLKADRRSLFNACAKAASDGLLPDGREGALVIFGKQAVWMPMVYGIIKKARQSGEVATLGARIVYENELKAPVDADGKVMLDADGKPLPPRFRFVIEDGEDKLEHDPILFGERGAPVGVYARVKFRDGSIEYEILSKTEVEKIRNVSRAKNSGPWVEWAEEMWKKSAVRRLAKRLPLSAELQTTISRDDEITEYQQIKEAERQRLLTSASSQFGAPIDGEVIEDEPESIEDDGWNAYLAKMHAELEAAKTPAEREQVTAAFMDKLNDAMAGLGPERSRDIADQWRSLTKPKGK